MYFKRFLSVLLTLVLMLGIYSTAFAVDNVSDYTPIYTAEDLNNVRNNLDGKYILKSNIDLSAYKSWVPIGSWETPFTGELNGNSFMIKNLNIIKVSGENPSAGLFGTVMDSRIKNVTVIGKINVNNDNGIRAGLICGEAYNSIISKCTTYGNVNASTKGGVWVGGIAGFLSEYSETDNEEKSSTVELCKNNANITATGKCNYKPLGINYFVGGIVGLSNEIISKCSNNGNVTAVGKNENYEYFYTLAGGICGNSCGELNNNYNTGNISSTGTRYVFAGGISGHWYQFGDIYNCYNIGQVNAEVKDAADDYVFSAFGGIIGEIEPLWIMGSEESSESSVSVSNCYYLNNVEKAFGEVSPENQFNVKSLTSDEMTNQSSFAGFDFENIWKMSESQNRPVLQDISDAVVISVKTKTGKSVELENIDAQNISSWGSVNENIALINEKGNVKGLSIGVTDIVITMNDGTVLECTVSVNLSVFWWIINLLFGWLK